MIDFKSRLKILFLSSWFPYPPDNGSQTRIYNLLQGLSQFHDVTLLSFARTAGIDVNMTAIKDLCQKVETVPWKEFNPKSLRASVGFANSKPRYLLDTYSPQMEQLIRQELSNGHNYDLVITSQLAMAAYWKALSGKPALLEEIELATFYDRYIQATSPEVKLRNGLTWFKTSHYVAKLLGHFKACTVVSDNEKGILGDIAPSYRSVEVIPNCVDFTKYEQIHPKPEPGTLIFTGPLVYSANYDALSFFLSEIYPLVKKDMPEAKLRVTGRYDGTQLPQGLIDSSVEFAGYVDDIKPVIADSWISVVPLRIGGGTRLKILEALALGTPVVSTTKGAEGLNVESGRHLLVADSPQEFAAATIRLLREPGLRAKLGQQGQGLIREQYDWQAVMPRFLSLVETSAQKGGIQ